MLLDVWGSGDVFDIFGHAEGSLRAPTASNRTFIAARNFEGDRRDSLDPKLAPGLLLKLQLGGELLQGQLCKSVVGPAAWLRCSFGRVLALCIRYASIVEHHMR